MPFFLSDEKSAVCLAWMRAPLPTSSAHRAACDNALPRLCSLFSFPPPLHRGASVYVTPLGPLFSPLHMFFLLEETWPGNIRLMEGHASMTHTYTTARGSLALSLRPGSI